MEKSITRVVEKREIDLVTFIKKYMKKITDEEISEAVYKNVVLGEVFEFYMVMKNNYPVKCKAYMTATPFGISEATLFIIGEFDSVVTGYRFETGEITSVAWCIRQFRNKQDYFDSFYVEVKK